MKIAFTLPKEVAQGRDDDPNSKLTMKLVRELFADLNFTLYHPHGYNSPNRDAANEKPLLPVLQKGRKKASLGTDFLGIIDSNPKVPIIEKTKASSKTHHKNGAYFKYPIFEIKTEVSRDDSANIKLILNYHGNTPKRLRKSILRQALLHYLQIDKIEEAEHPLKFQLLKELATQALYFFGPEDLTEEFGKEIADHGERFKAAIPPEKASQFSDLPLYVTTYEKFVTLLNGNNVSNPPNMPIEVFIRYRKKLESECRRKIVENWQVYTDFLDYVQAHLNGEKIEPPKSLLQDLKFYQKIL